MGFRPPLRFKGGQGLGSEASTEQWSDGGCESADDMLDKAAMNEVPRKADSHRREPMVRIGNVAERMQSLLSSDGGLLGVSRVTELQSRQFTLLIVASRSTCLCNQNLSSVHQVSERA